MTKLKNRFKVGFLSLLIPLTACTEAFPPGVVNSKIDGGENTTILCDNEAALACPSGLECVAGICVEPTLMPVDAGPMLEGRIQVTPEAVDFGAFDFGTIIERRVTIKNIGRAELHLLEIALEDDPAQEFQVSGASKLLRLLQIEQFHH